MPACQWVSSLIREFYFPPQGLGREELTRILLAMRFLWKVLQEDVTKLRFWGKIYGQKSDYYIVEAEFEGDSDPSEKIPGPWDKWRPPKPPKLIKEQETEEFTGKIPQIRVKFNFQKTNSLLLNLLDLMPFAK